MCPGVLGLCTLAASRRTGLQLTISTAVGAQALSFSSLFSRRVNLKSSYLVFYLFFLVFLSLHRAWCSPTLPFLNNTTTVNHINFAIFVAGRHHS